jgi:hypothetical protein
MQIRVFHRGKGRSINYRPKALGNATDGVANALDHATGDVLNALDRATDEVTSR